MNNGDPFQIIYPPEPPTSDPKSRRRRNRIAAIVVGVLVIAGIYAQEIIRQLAVQRSSDLVLTAAHGLMPTATSLAQGTAVRPGGADTEELAAAILSYDNLAKSVRVLFNGDYIVIDITLKDSCNEVPLSSSCKPLINDLGGLIFQKYPAVKQLGGMAVVVNGEPEFSAPIDAWEQIVTTPHP